MEKERIIFLRGKKVNLRPLDKHSDLNKCLKWANDPDVRYFLSLYLPISEQEEVKWFDKEDETKIKLAIETRQGKFIGTITLIGIDYRNGIATTGTMIGEKEYWGKGYGTDAKMILLNYAFNVLNLRKIYSRVFAFNKRSVNYSKKCGYKTEGIFRQDRFINGKYVDVICLAVFKKDWLKIWQEYKVDLKAPE